MFFGYEIRYVELVGRAFGDSGKPAFASLKLKIMIAGFRMPVLGLVHKTSHLDFKGCKGQHTSQTSVTQGLQDEVNPSTLGILPMCIPATGRISSILKSSKTLDSLRSFHPLISLNGHGDEQF